MCGSLIFSFALFAPIQSSLRDESHVIPAINRWAIVGRPSGTNILYSCACAGLYHRRLGLHHSAFSFFQHPLVIRRHDFHELG